MLAGRCLVALALAFSAGASAAQHAPHADVRHVVYAADLSDFPNPERGFSKSKGTAASARAAGMTLVHVYFRLDPYRNVPLPADFLEKTRHKFADARAGGVKLVPRFTYNFPEGDFDPRVDGDAPLSRVLQHLDQLAPILRDNADVIAFLEAGFVGAWGEWHDSTSGLDRLEAKRAILNRLLEILPMSRAVSLRYGRDKRAIFDRAIPITSAEAFTGMPVARVGHHNDCFLASVNDWDTYRPGEQRAIKAEKSYLSAENRFVPQGGETCNIAADAQPFIGCKNAVAEVADQHWSQLNSEYHPGVLGLWKRQGCYSEISKRLGYRFRLIRSDYAAWVQRGTALTARIVLTNDGFAAPYNPRSVELILRGPDRQEVRLPLAVDPRRWLPGTPVSLKLAVRLPKTMPRGTYTAFLALPDPAPRLRGRAAYAIRLANHDSWQPHTGDNALNWRVQVRDAAVSSRRAKGRRAKRQSGNRML